VDARLAAWTSAVVEAQAALASMAGVVGGGGELLPSPAQPAFVEPPAVAAEGRVQPAEPDAAPAPPAPRSASQEEDETLLASLDPETAKAIRVMRRTSFENKSVRELLEEYLQTRNAQGFSENPEQRKKSWWSRG
jgi:hypothetical protein